MLAHMRKLVAVNGRGQRIGESHPRATVPQATVDAIIDYAEIDHLTCVEIARKLGLNKSYVSRVLRGTLRCQLPEMWVSRDI